MSEQPWMAGYLRIQRMREVIASVSLSHPEDCPCTTCRAAAGDKQALAVMLLVLAEDEQLSGGEK